VEFIRRTARQHRRLMSAFDLLRTLALELEGGVVEQIRNAFDSIPAAMIAFAGPVAIYTQAAWASPFLKTYRHGISGALAVLSGLFLMASLRDGRPVVVILLIAAAVAMAAMLVTLLWPPTLRPVKRKVR
jgi:hypothetical protein